MLDTVCSLPLSSDLFSQAIHPNEPVVSVGLASGHVQTFRLPHDETDSDDGASNSSSPNGKGHIDTMWRTRRHKGSCRCLGFSVDGEMLYSAGTDGLVKMANSESGQVQNKIAIPLESNGSIDAPTVIHALSPQTLLLATDSSALHLYDLRVPYSKVSARPEQSHHPHDDYISSLTPLPASETSTSGFSKQWVTTGGTTLAVTDLRRGVLVRSEDQEEELVSSAFIGGLPSSGTSRGEKVAVGGSNGIVTLWEKGAWDDQDERVYVQRDAGGGEAIETLVTVPDDMGMGKMLAAGLGNGLIKFIRVGPNKVASEVVHDETEGVVGIGFDVEGRMVSGGGQIVKVWHEAAGGDSLGKHMMDSDDSGDDSDDSDSEQKRKAAANMNDRKKRKKGKSGRGTGPDVIAFDMD
ncbi:WD40 repeat-containing protein [Penicillium ucsense]|uniref:WD repeat-containing protein JIP5 n=1 Tax=Penicillium ucsense TaxID=2839758 RepID=A0A8J8VZR8_9EURO|nr:WD40 repeat-containing protein [Penicillium ucsense]KAF7734437.1 WD40 repeat-containing protein [Penicillium ucsense]